MILIIPGIGSGQQFILLENKNHSQRFSYYIGDAVHIKTLKGIHIEGILMEISESGITIGMEKVSIANIGLVYKQRWLFSFFSAGFIAAGGGFFLVESFNNLISGEKTIIAKEEVLTSVALVGVALFLKFIDERKCNIRKEWQLKIIDFNIFDEAYRN